MGNFCSNCGQSLNGGNFCGGCGTAASEVAPALSAAPNAPLPTEEPTIWTGSPDPVLSPIEGKTTKYELTSQRLIIRKGLIGKSLDTVELFRVKDIQVHRSLTQRARGRGDVWLVSVDPIQPVTKLESIENAEDVAAKIRQCVMACRAANRTVSIEGL